MIGRTLTVLGATVALLAIPAGAGATTTAKQRRLHRHRQHVAAVTCRHRHYHHYRQLGGRRFHSVGSCRHYVVHHGIVGFVPQDDSWQSECQGAGGDYDNYFNPEFGIQVEQCTWSGNNPTMAVYNQLKADVTAYCQTQDGSAGGTPPPNAELTCDYD